MCEKEEERGLRDFMRFAVVSICRSFQRALPPQPKPAAALGLAVARHLTASRGVQ